MTIIETFLKGIKNPKKALSAVNHKSQSALGFSDYNYKRFIVLTRSRTGSNLLISLLNSHPHIKAEGEIFNKLNGDNYKTVLDKAFSKQPYSIKAKGFKIFYYHPLDDNSGDIWQELKAMDDLYVIHLKRENILRILLSRKIAGIQDIWAIRSEENRSTPRENVSVSFTEEELRDGFTRTRDWEEYGDENFRNHSILTVTYEDLVNDRSSTFRKVTDFLGIQYIKPDTELKKQNTKTIRESIKNYDELKSAFAKTELAPFFED